MARRNRKPNPATSAAPAEVIVDEVTEQVDTTIPPEAVKPVRQVGMSNLAQTIRQHRHRYDPVIHPNGKKTFNNGDHIAAVLLHVPLPMLEAFVHGHFGKSYERLNNGHRRMCCGNLIRAAFGKSDTKVVEWVEDMAAKIPQEEEVA